MEAVFRVVRLGFHPAIATVNNPALSGWEEGIRGGGILHECLLKTGVAFTLPKRLIGGGFYRIPWSCLRTDHHKNQQRSPRWQTRPSHRATLGRSRSIYTVLIQTDLDDHLPVGLVAHADGLCEG